MNGKRLVSLLLAAVFLSAVLAAFSSGCTSGAVTTGDATTGNATTGETTTDNTLPGTSWVLTSYSKGTDSLVSVLEDTLVNVTFDENGDIGGLASCNSYWGTYITDGDKLSIVSLDSTHQSCPEPAGAMEQEETYLKGLRDAATFEIKEDTLELRADDGSLLASYDAWKLPPGG